MTTTFPNIKHNLLAAPHIQVRACVCLGFKPMLKDKTNNTNNQLTNLNNN
jgi:hypothetical protein